LAASLAAYGYYQPFFLLQLLAATAVAFGVGRRIAAAVDRRQKKRLVGLGALLLVSNLLVVKYIPFLNESVRHVVGWFGADYSVPVLAFLMPIGVSFYTFQLISYLVDIYRGAPPEA